jgi:electron-transferring-flavoprotein dehydrogenase
MKSGMLAAESIAAAIAAGHEKTELMDYDAAVRSSWIATELKVVQNAEPAVAKFGGDIGTVLAGIDMWMRTLKIGLPISMKHHADYTNTGRADLYPKIDYPKPDGVITFDRLTNVAYSYTNHAEDQPCHLQVSDLELQKVSELGVFGGPSARYCPAGVYEWLTDEKTGEPKFQINSQNCVHCKTCDIKDPNQNINWVTPEGGGGPNYPNM